MWRQIIEGNVYIRSYWLLFLWNHYTLNEETVFNIWIYLSITTSWLIYLYVNKVVISLFPATLYFKELFHYSMQSLILFYCCSELEASKPKWVNPNYIQLNTWLTHLGSEISNYSINLTAVIGLILISRPPIKDEKIIGLFNEN